MISFCRFFIGSLLSGVALAANTFVVHAAEPAVVVSIKPIHSLASAVMEGVGSPQLLLNGPTDPHSHAMRPSQARAVENADVLIWVGPSLEQFLQASVENLSAETHVLTLLDVQDIVVSRVRDLNSGEVDTNPDSGDGQDAQGDHHHDPTLSQDNEAAHTHVASTGSDSAADQNEGQTDHFHLDGHIWLNPVNAAAMATAIRDSLIAVDPQNEALYQQNTQALITRISATDDRIRQLLSTVTDLRYFVAHDAYQGFEQHYNLLPGGVLRVNPVIPPGARHLRELRKTMVERNIECVLSEPWFPPKFLKVLTEGTRVSVATIDALGVDIASGPGHWFELMNSVTAGFLRCRSAP